MNGKQRRQREDDERYADIQFAFYADDDVPPPAAPPVPPKPPRRNDQQRMERVIHDDDLQRWYREWKRKQHRSRMGLSVFVRENRDAIDARINEKTDQQKGQQ